MTIEAFVGQLNSWGSKRTPFFFAVDFEMVMPFACELKSAAANGITFDINGYSNVNRGKAGGVPRLDRKPISFDDYVAKFAIITEGLSYGDSFLTNLTIRTEITCDLSLSELYSIARARYKLLFRDLFLVFSPETFVRIQNGRIHTFPMKGTIDAAQPDAANAILNDRKELAEHVTIVDLMRNDLSQVSTHVRVDRFRYINELKTNNKNLLQVSSEIVGDLEGDYWSRIGTILVALLPAGSVSGAPKAKTVELIRKAEGEARGYYAGVFGYFDGANFESAVMIRFIEQTSGRLYYRSGGGITTQSRAESEYQEAIDKIYVPVD